MSGLKGEASKARRVSARLGARTGTGGWRRNTPIRDEPQHDARLSICKLSLYRLGAETTLTIACTTGHAPDWYYQACHLL